MQITKPSLIIDENRCRKNIERMFLKARTAGLEFRPHFKTHQSINIGRIYKEYGINKITVSSVEMAKYFSIEWKDITIAFPVNILEIEEINILSESINLNLLVESKESAAFLSKYLSNKVGIYIKIDTGYHRTGINANNKESIDEILLILSASKQQVFKGFLAHAGHAYNCKTKNEVLKVHNNSTKIMIKLKSQYIKQYPKLIISIGDTPSCSIAENFSGIDEIRPGNFVFYDLTQEQIGSCKIEDIAVSVACPIVAIHKERSEIVIYGGGVHFSKEGLKVNNQIIFGKVVENNNTKSGKLIPNMYIKSLSQEHGVVTVPKSIINEYKIGDILLILPVHSCMTANLMRV